MSGRPREGEKGGGVRWMERRGFGGGVNLPANGLRISHPDGQLRGRALVVVQSGLDYEGGRLESEGDVAVARLPGKNLYFGVSMCVDSCWRTAGRFYQVHPLAAAVVILVVFEPVQFCSQVQQLRRPLPRGHDVAWHLVAEVSVFWFEGFHFSILHSHRMSGFPERSGIERDSLRR